jgi:hypothetical protein
LWPVARTIWPPLPRVLPLTSAIVAINAFASGTSSPFLATVMNGRSLPWCST